jgi:23S rRNA-/tRNA-specific pseudouridylate synthase
LLGADSPTNSHVPFVIDYQPGLYIVLDKPHDLRIDGDFSLSLEKWLSETYPNDFTTAPGHSRWAHRLDYATSGVIIVPFTRPQANRFAALFEGRRLTKVYSALIEGIVAGDHADVVGEGLEGDPVVASVLRGCAVERPYFVVATRIGPDPADERGFRQTEVESGGKVAVTVIKVLAHVDYTPRRRGGPCPGETRKVTKVDMYLFTGRTHQLRVHTSARGHPIVNDFTYGPSDNRDDPDQNRMCLHARHLSGGQGEAERVGPFESKRNPW